MNTETLSKNVERLLSFRSLQQGWNGKDAPALSGALFELVEGILKQLSIQPKIFPTARDSIQLQYENPNDDYMSFEVFSNGEIKVFQYFVAGEQKTEYVGNNSNLFNTMVNEFYGRKL